MTDGAGNLSLDFLAGFTIFMIALIYVATLIPGLLIGLESKSIDYDAVAYRTGVILTEDPGMPYNPAWETYSDDDKGNVLRFGLALSKNAPNILSPEKIDRFFNTTTFGYPDDYRSRVVFGDYPYQFNISLKIDGGKNYTLGDPLPDSGYGYSRRLVKIKEESSAAIDGAQIPSHPEYWSHETGAGLYCTTISNFTGPSTHPFSIYFNYTELTADGPQYNNPAYQIDPIAPLYDGIIVNLTNLKKTTRFGTGDTNGDANTTINLTSVTITQSVLSPYLHTRQPFSTIPITINNKIYYIYADGNITPADSIPVTVANNVTLIIPHGSVDTGLNFLGKNDPSTYLNVTLQFELNHGDWFLNSSKAQPYGAFEYNYTSHLITQPSLKDGVLEVAVW